MSWRDGLDVSDDELASILLDVLAYDEPCPECGQRVCANESECEEHAHARTDAATGV